MQRSLTFTFGSLVLLVWISASCAPSEPWKANNPELALRSLLTALAMGDFPTVWEFLDQPTRAFLEETATARLAALGEDEVPEGPRLLDSLYRVWAPSAYYMDHLETIVHDEDHATVVIHSIYDTQIATPMTRDGERWTISLISNEDSGPEQE